VNFTVRRDSDFARSTVSKNGFIRFAETIKTCISVATSWQCEFRFQNVSHSRPEAGNTSLKNCSRREIVVWNSPSFGFDESYSFNFPEIHWFLIRAHSLIINASRQRANHLRPVARSDSGNGGFHREIFSLSPKLIRGCGCWWENRLEETVVSIF